FVLQADEGAAMVFGKYRFSSYSSPESPHSELSSRKMPQSGTAVRNGSADYVVSQLQIIYVSALGRTAPEAGGIPRVASNSQTAKAKRDLIWSGRGAGRLSACEGRQ